MECAWFGGPEVLTVADRPEPVPGETVVVNAAAGGVGSLAVQLARHFGAGRVIGTASTGAKRDLAVRHGADVAVSGDADGYAERVVAANGGRPVDVVLDAIGGRVVSAGLETLATFGRLVTFGNASREGRPPLDPGSLADTTVGVFGFWLRPAGPPARSPCAPDRGGR